MSDITLRTLVTSAAPFPGSNGFSAAFSALSGSIRAEIDILSPKTEMLPHQSRIGNARIFRVPSEATEHSVHALCRAMARQMEGRDYDVVHAFDPLTAQVALQTTGSHRVVYEPILDSSAISEAWWTAHDHAIAKATVLITSSHTMFDDAKRPDAHVVPPAVPVSLFPRPLHPNQSLRLLFLGELSPHRDLDTLIDAIGRAQSRHPSLRVLVAGESDPMRREHFRNKLLDHALDTVVKVRGEPELSALGRLCGACDVAVVTASPAERLEKRGYLPQPFLSLLGGGLPVVVADLPTTREFLIDDRNAFFYQPGDATSLSNQVDRLTDEKARRTLSRSGQIHVAERFSIARRSEQYQRIYASMYPDSQRSDAWEDAFPQEETQTHSPLEEHADTAIRNQASIVSDDWDPDTKQHDRSSLMSPLEPK